MRNVHKTLSKHILADGFPLVIDLEKSQGSYIIDSNGDQYLDMFSMFASSPIGYNHPYIIKHKEELLKAAINKLALSDIYPKEFADFLEVFERVAIPPQLEYCFFIDGGALAVENALKAAFDWKTKLNLAKGINQEASQVIHFKEAFHGRTGYTLSLTNTSDPRKYEYFPKFSWPRILTPKLTFPLTDENLAKTIELEKEALKQIQTTITNNPNDIACLILEPIQAEGGDNHFRAEFLQNLRDICDNNDILLIFDEVQTGLGLTGKMWAFQHYDVTPDIIAFGKKSQVCGILANKEKLDRVDKNVFKESSRINSTFGGNLTDMVRFKLILEVLESENLLDNAKELGIYLKESLQKLSVDYPETISNIRGLGLMVAFDFPNAKLRDAFLKNTYNNKMLILGCGNSSIRFRPHLTVSKEDIDKAIEIIRHCLSI